MTGKKASCCLKPPNDRLKNGERPAFIHKIFYSDYLTAKE